MKSTLKIIAVLCCIQFSLTASAQISKKDFAGIWEFSQFGTDTLKMGPAAQGVLKVVTDSTFAVVRRQLSGAIITQSGTFRVPDKDFYVQKLLFQLPVFGTEGIGQEAKIYYRFSADKKSILFSYALSEGGVGYEVWRKL